MNQPTQEPRLVYRLFIDGHRVITTYEEGSAYDCLTVCAYTGRRCELTCDGQTIDQITPWNQETPTP
jgi:hypothetical protein